MVETLRKRLPIERKLAAVEPYQTGRYTCAEIAERFGLKSHTTILKWVKNQEKFKKQIPSAKKCKPSMFTHYSELERHLVQWFNSLRSVGIQVLRHTIILQALTFAKELGLNNFSASTSSQILRKETS